MIIFLPNLTNCVPYIYTLVISIDPCRLAVVVVIKSSIPYLIIRLLEQFNFFKNEAKNVQKNPTP